MHQETYGSKDPNTTACLFLISAIGANILRADIFETKTMGVIDREYLGGYNMGILYTVDLTKNRSLNSF